MDNTRDSDPGATAEVYEELKDLEPQATEEVEVSADNTAAEAETEVVAETEDTPVADNKNSAKERIRELSSDLKEEKVVNKTLADVLKESDINFDLPNQQMQLQPGQEISQQDYQRHVLQTANSLVDLKLKAFQNANRIRTEINDAVAEYGELNPRTKDSFDSDLSDSVTESVESFVKANPTGNVKGYIDKLMKPYKKSVQSQVVKERETVAKQASQTALRPTVTKAPPSKKFNELSLEEMERKLGKVY